MKTAEELCVEVWNEAKKGLFPTQLVSRIRAIQLDAYRAGIGKAANLCLAAGDNIGGEFCKELSDTEMQKASGYYECQELLEKASETAQLP